MTYEQFKEYLIEFLWKAGDAVLVSRLDSLIKMGESSLNRDWRTHRRNKSHELAMDALDIALPEDYFSIRSVTSLNEQLGEFGYVEPAELRALRDMTSLSGWQPVYSLSGNILMISGPYHTYSDGSDGNPVYQPALVIDYESKVPAFVDQPDDGDGPISWVAEDFLDLYTYAVLKHTAPFLREDERVALWSQLYGEIIAAENERTAHEQVRGVYAPKTLPRAAGVPRRGDRKGGPYPRNGRL